jgi:hypothetical protein
VKNIVFGSYLLYQLWNFPVNPDFRILIPISFDYGESTVIVRVNFLDENSWYYQTIALLCDWWGLGHPSYSVTNGSIVPKLSNSRISSICDC